MYGRRNPLTDIWTYIPMARAEYRALPDAEREVVRQKAAQDMEAAKAKRKLEIAEEKAAKDKRARTCQICARRIFAETGVIAHHGYERPGGGWQTASCRGARKLPYEADHEELDTEIEWVASRLEKEEEFLRKLIAEEVSLSIKWTDHEERRTARANGTLNDFTGTKRLEGITRENFDAMRADPANKEAFSQSYIFQFDTLKDQKVRRQQATVDQVREYLAWQKKRRAEWVLKERWEVIDTYNGKWVAVEA